LKGGRGSYYERATEIPKESSGNQNTIFGKKLKKQNWVGKWKSMSKKTSIRTFMG